MYSVVLLVGPVKLGTDQRPSASQKVYLSNSANQRQVRTPTTMTATHDTTPVAPEQMTSLVLGPGSWHWQWHCRPDGNVPEAIRRCDWTMHMLMFPM